MLIDGQSSDSRKAVLLNLKAPRFTWVKRGRHMSTTTKRWTSADLERLPDDGTRYEIIDGELFMSKSPHVFHLRVCSELHKVLSIWNDIANSGEVFEGAGLIFAPDDDVIPDLIWISNERIKTALRADGHIYDAAELVIEVLSPGSANERRDRV